MSDELRSVAEQIQSELQSSATDDDAAYLSKAVLVSEWHSPSGDVWINLHRFSGSGDDITRWDAGGLLHYALTELNSRKVTSDDEEDD